MNKNLTSINVVMDMSGSMQSLRADTIGSFNTLLRDQKSLPGKALLTLALFNDTYTLPYDAMPLELVGDLTEVTYAPTGGTALLDALGRTINATGAKLAAMPEAERPSKVIFVVITDGHENTSREFKKTQIAQMITHQREAYNWEFVFIGANMDSMAEATSLGISAKNALNYQADSAGTHRAYNAMTKGLRSYRTGDASRVEGVLEQK